MKINLPDWYKDFNRPLTLHQAQIYSWSCSDPLKKIFGQGIYNQMYILRNDNSDGYFLKKEKDEFDTHIFNNYFNNNNFLKNSNKTILKKALIIESYFNNFKNITISTLNNQELLKLFKKTIKILDAGSAAIWIGFLLDKVIEKKLVNILEKNKLAIKSTIKIIGGIEKPNHIIQEQLDLMKIVLSKKKYQGNKLQKHYNKYKYIPCYGLDVEPYSLLYFSNRLKKITKKQAQEIIAKIKTDFKNNRKKYNYFIKNQKLPLKDQLFIEYLHEFIFFKDYRSHFRSLSMFYHGQLLREIARRYNIESKEIFLLLRQEIITIFNDPIKIKNIIAQRKNQKLVYIFRSGQEIITNQDKIIKSNIKGKKIIKGQPASPGLTSGIVKVVLNPNSIDKVKKGDILVATMTRPDYIVAMKNASAIITDEGGLLCHAAIISREMKKPCIIGTKNATQILKDGDKVEVDANKGIIKILDKI